VPGAISCTSGTTKADSAARAEHHSSLAAARLGKHGVGIGSNGEGRYERTAARPGCTTACARLPSCMSSPHTCRLPSILRRYEACHAPCTCCHHRYHWARRQLSGRFAAALLDHLLVVRCHGHWQALAKLLRYCLCMLKNLANEDGRDEGGIAARARETAPSVLLGAPACCTSPLPNSTVPR
jgi:hypothetical protein